MKGKNAKGILCVTLRPWRFQRIRAQGFITATGANIRKVTPRSLRETRGQHIRNKIPNPGLFLY